MNVSMGDTFNLGWKLISVPTGRPSPDLLHSYSEECRAAAKGLVDFDYEWSRVVGAPSGDENPTAADSAITKLCDYLENNSKSPVRVHTPGDAEIYSIIEVNAVFQQGFRELSFADRQSMLKPGKGQYGLTDYEKMYCTDLKNGDDIFDMRGVDRAEGCIVIARPGQYVGHILPLDAYNELAAFFGGFLLPRNET